MHRRVFPYVVDEIRATAFVPRDVILPRTYQLNNIKFGYFVVFCEVKFKVKGFTGTLNELLI